MMSKVFALAIFLASTQALSIKINPKAEIALTECAAGTADWVEASLSIDPYPVQIATGKKVTVDGFLNLKQEIPAGYSLALEEWGIPYFGLPYLITCDLVSYTFFNLYVLY